LANFATVQRSNNGKEKLNKAILIYSGTPIGK